ncbi:hypothetical protein QBC38DRAFT_479653 [Podospora fimiseda]|uniref:Uncharacterized protein n=1 Tax=Podospora fimiseda TaxID=252190 RepID=A0AAN7H3L3_9PEZI|nr:hypothetical protein QBC38DRAFT_479653 [Podospora fimiseda]
MHVFYITLSIVFNSLAAVQLRFLGLNNTFSFPEKVSSFGIMISLELVLFSFVGLRMIILLPFLLKRILIF